MVERVQLAVIEILKAEAQAQAKQCLVGINIQVVYPGNRQA